MVRPFNTYGPRQSARAVIPTIIAQLASGQETIRLGAEHPTRDFNFVEDTVAGFMAVGFAGDQVLGEVVNIGSGFEISIGDTARLIAEVMGTPVRIETESQRLRPAKSEVERLWASNDKARALVGWTPRHHGVDGFRKGLEHTVRWFRDPANLSRYKAGMYNI